MSSRNSSKAGPDISVKQMRYMLGAVYMIPGWKNSGNNYGFLFRMKFVLHSSHDKIESLNLRHSHEHGFHSRSNTHSPLAQVWFQFTWYHNEISYENKNFTRMNSFQNDLNRNCMLLQYQVSKYREIIIMEIEWTHSRMKVISASGE